MTALAGVEEIITDLWILLGRQEALRADWVHGINRMRELLASIFPALERVFAFAAVTTTRCVRSRPYHYVAR